MIQKNGNTKIIWGIRGLLTIVLIVFCLGVWPGYFIHDFYLSKTSSVHGELTQILENGELVVQYFIPQATHLGSIQFVLSYEEEKAEEQILTFLLCEENGKEILTKEVPIKEIKRKLYYDMPVNKRLKPGQIYYWALVMPADLDASCSVMYTNVVEDQAPENLYFTINDQLSGGETAQTVSQYNYYAHPDKAVILGVYWISAFLVYLVALEIVDRIFKRNKNE